MLGEAAREVEGEGEGEAEGRGGGDADGVGNVYEVESVAEAWNLEGVIESWLDRPWAGLGTTQSPIKWIGPKP